MAVKFWQASNHFAKINNIAPASGSLYWQKLPEKGFRKLPSTRKLSRENGASIIRLSLTCPILFCSKGLAVKQGHLF